MADQNLQDEAAEPQSLHFHKFLAIFTIYDP
jgi:hypothetical protein